MSQDPNLNLPVKSGDDFVGELETMDLSVLKGQQFMVAASTGDRSKATFLCSTIRGPFSFEEMCEAVGMMWKKEQHHAKALMCGKVLSEPLKLLDENTVDYIEAHFEDIITEAMLDGVFDDAKDYTCRAGVVEADNSDNPMRDKSADVLTGSAAQDEEDDRL